MYIRRELIQTPCVQMSTPQYCVNLILLIQGHLWHAIITVFEESSISPGSNDQMIKPSCQTSVNKKHTLHVPRPCSTMRGTLVETISIPDYCLYMRKPNRTSSTAQHGTETRPHILTSASEAKIQVTRGALENVANKIKSDMLRWTVLYNLRVTLHSGYITTKIIPGTHELRATPHTEIMLGGMTLLNSAQKSSTVSNAMICLRFSAHVSVADLSLGLSYHNTHLHIKVRGGSGKRGMSEGIHQNQPRVS